MSIGYTNYEFVETPDEVNNCSGCRPEEGTINGCRDAITLVDNRETFERTQLLVRDTSNSNCYDPTGIMKHMALRDQKSDPLTRSIVTNWGDVHASLQARVDVFSAKVLTAVLSKNYEEMGSLLSNLPAIDLEADAKMTLALSVAVLCGDTQLTQMLLDITGSSGESIVPASNLLINAGRLGGNAYATAVMMVTHDNSYFDRTEFRPIRVAEEMFLNNQTETAADCTHILLHSGKFTIERMFMLGAKYRNAVIIEALLEHYEARYILDDLRPLEENLGIKMLWKLCGKSYLKMPFTSAQATAALHTFLDRFNSNIFFEFDKTNLDVLIYAIDHHDANPAFILELISDNGLDPTSSNNAALTHAGKMGFLQAFDVLLKDRRVERSVADNDNALLMNAAINFCPAALRRLVQCDNVDPSARNDQALQLATESYHHENVVVLIEHEKVNAAACDNRAIKTALRNEDFYMVNILLNNENVNLCDLDAPTVESIVRLIST